MTKEPERKPLAGQVFSQKLSPTQSASTEKAIIIEAMLHKYWHDTPAKPVWAQMIRDWLAAMEPFSPVEVEAACREHVLRHPSQRPNEGHIREIANAKRAADRKRLSLPPPPDTRGKITSERATAILAEFGFRGAASQFGGNDAD